MLTELHIRGLAIIDSLSIQFTPGFNVITGETGAGKSIFIRALNLLMGAKVSSGTIRQGCEEATVAAQFWVPSGHAAVALLEHMAVGFEVQDKRVGILVRRLISEKGRSQAWMNDEVVTTQTLREMGTQLLDIFAQHENQRLLDVGRHLGYIDRFVKEPELIEKVACDFHDTQSIVAGLEGDLQTWRNGNQSEDYLRFRLSEMQEFEASEEDFAETRDYVHNAERLLKQRDTIAGAISLLDPHGGGNAVSGALREASRRLGKLTEETAEITGFRTDLDELSIRVGEIHFQLSKILGEESGEGEFERAQERLFGYQALFRKLSVSDVRGLLSEKKRIEGELQRLEDISERVKASLASLEEKACALMKSAGKLTQARRTAMKQIQKIVEKELADLAMVGAILDVSFSPVERTLPLLDLSAFGNAMETRWKSLVGLLSAVSETGLERGQFLLSANKGESPMPLAKVASGGELSRIMLALKRALSSDAETCVLVFDEIDTGISGRVADVVGHKMLQLANGCQVVCISHLPQVAAYADSHYLVKKGKRKDRTETTIERLTPAESTREIARLLSGEEVSKPSLANAALLIEKARGQRGKGA